VAGSPPRHEACSGRNYQDTGKVERLLGSGIWAELRGRTVLDFGSGFGHEAVEIAQRGAARVIGLDVQERMVAAGRDLAASAGVSHLCEFATRVDEPVDVIVSLDGFEHFADPAGVLAQMRRLLAPGGRIFISFGPTWFHPYGGHLFSVFPWAHLVFSEKALIRWRTDFKTDGATRFHEVAGGLNGMTIARFRRLVHASGLEVESLTPVPIRKLRTLCRGPAREFFTSIVRCQLRKAPGVADRAG
jgi:SAM-dependent methyltransferase